MESLFDLTCFMLQIEPLYKSATPMKFIDVTEAWYEISIDADLANSLKIFVGFIGTSFFFAAAGGVAFIIFFAETF